MLRVILSLNQAKSRSIPAGVSGCIWLFGSDSQKQNQFIPLTLKLTKLGHISRLLTFLDPLSPTMEWHPHGAAMVGLHMAGGRSAMPGVELIAKTHRRSIRTPSLSAAMHIEIIIV